MQAEGRRHKAEGRIRERVNVDFSSLWLVTSALCLMKKGDPMRVAFDEMQRVGGYCFMYDATSATKSS